MEEHAVIAKAGENKDPSHSATLVLPQELTIYTVAEVHSTWVNWLSTLETRTAEGAAQVQAGGVEQVDAAGVQLLISLQGGLASKSRTLHISGASIALATAFDGLGLADWLLAHSEGATS